MDITLDQLVAYAYNLHCCETAVEAGPPEVAAWFDKATFAIIATVGTETVPDAALRAMLRQMLEARFQLKTHTTSKIVPAYILEVAPGGAKLRPAGACNPNGTPQDRPGAVPLCGMNGNRNGYPVKVTESARSVTMAELADWWESSLLVVDHRPIVDRTGLPGKYDFDFSVRLPSGSLAIPGNLQELVGKASAALESQDGLKLDVFHAVKVPIPVRVIDHAVIPVN